MRIRMFVVAVWITATALAEAPLIPREVLFGNDVRTAPRISPDGTRLATLAPDENGVQNVWVETINKSDGRFVTHEAHRPIFDYDWAPNGKQILYQQDGDGDENTHLFAADLDGLNVR